MATLSTTTIVPRLVNVSARAIDDQGKPIAGIAGVTFSIYKDQTGGSPRWMETQNVVADAKGNYTAQLGATSAEGLPLDVFASGEARWLGVRVNGGEEQPRVLLLSVPYALKAADAETLGGQPASAFLLAGAVNASAAKSNVAVAAQSSASPATTSDVTTSGGTVNTLPLFTTATNVQNSIVTQTGSGGTAKIGINTSTPATTLDVKGGATIRGPLALPGTGTATSSAGKNSQPQKLTASSFNSGTNAAVSQTFQWQAEPAANNTSTPSGSLNLLYASGTASPAETGLMINNQGIFTFAPGQTFPIPAAAVTDAMLANPSVTIATSGPLTGGGVVTLGGMTAIGLQSCNSNQILQFIGGAWACADLSTGPAGGGVQEFLTSGILTVPPGVTHMLVEMWGAGGGGGGGVTGATVIVLGGGGGAGGYTRAAFPVTPGATYNIVVGAGGAVGSDGVMTCTESGCTPTSASGTPGGTGGSSEITDSFSNVLATAAGGVGGSPGSAYCGLGLICTPQMGSGGAGGIGTSSTNSVGRTGGSGQQGTTGPPYGAGGVPSVGSIPQPGGAGGSMLHGIGQTSGSPGYILVTY